MKRSVRLLWPARALRCCSRVGRIGVELLLNRNIMAVAPRASQRGKPAGAARASRAQGADDRLVSRPGPRCEPPFRSECGVAKTPEGRALLCQRREHRLRALVRPAAGEPRHELTEHEPS